MCDALADGTAVVGAFGHPAFLKEHHFFNLKSILSKSLLGHILMTSTEPLFLSCSVVDHTFNTESRRRAVDIMNEIEVCYQLQLVSGVQHGFALRGNLNNHYERES